MKKLNHPNLVKMIGICVEKSPFYLVQELCQNGDLKNYLKQFEFVKVEKIGCSLPALSPNSVHCLGVSPHKLSASQQEI